MLAAGVNMTLELLAAHQKQLEAVNNNAYIPWLIIISDGDSTERPDDVNAAEHVQELLRAHELKTMCLNIGSGSNSLPAFTLAGKIQSVKKTFSLLYNKHQSPGEVHCFTGEFSFRCFVVSVLS